MSRSQTTTIIHHQHRVVEGDSGDPGDPVQVWSFCVNNYNYHQHQYPALRHPALTIGMLFTVQNIGIGLSTSG